MPYDEPEQTELIDVSAVGDALVDEVSGTKTEGDQTTADDIVAPEAPAQGTRLATIGERFAAFWIDATLLFCAYWAGVGCYHQFVHGSWVGPAPWIGMRGALFHALMAACIFLYYIVTEGILYATPGKLACRMAVRRRDGGPASYTSIIVRNLLRPIDTVFLGFIALLFMESTVRCQRLGDLVAGTIVVKKQSSVVGPSTLPAGTRRSSVNREALVGSMGRLLSGLFDGVLIVLFAGGWSLLLNPNAPVASLWLLLLSPAATLCFIAILQTATGTSPGKWLLGYGVVQENGMPIGFSHAVLRTLFLPIDCTGLGLLCVVLSPCWQRIGDAIAGTVVCRRARHWSGAVGLLAALACAGSLAYLGWMNPTSWLRQPDFHWSFLPQIDAFPEWPMVTTPPEPLAVKNFRCAAGSPEIKRTPAVYLPGETAYFLFEVHGYQKTDRQVWIQQDLVVRYPDLTFGLRQENIIDYKQVVHGKGAIELINNVNLPLTAMPGKYTVFVTLRDRFAGKQVVLQEQFEVKGDLPPPQPAAETSAIQESLQPATPVVPEGPAPATKPEEAKATAPTTTTAPTVMAAPSIPAPPTSGGPATAPSVLPGPTPSAPPPPSATTPTVPAPPTFTQPPIAPYATPQAVSPPAAPYGTPTPSPMTPAMVPPPETPYGSPPATGPTVLPATAPPGMTPAVPPTTESPESPRSSRKRRGR